MSVTAYECTDAVIFGHSVPDRRSACKAEEEDIAVAMSTDDNAADDCIAGTDDQIIIVPVY